MNEDCFQTSVQYKLRYFLLYIINVVDGWIDRSIDLTKCYTV